MEITIYGTKTCMKCKIFANKLVAKKIAFTKVEDEAKAVELGEILGVSALPIVEIDGKFYNESEAIKILKV